ncbi:Uncharacterised protein r2_g1346 [Pycnogonum litorale]
MHVVNSTSYLTINSTPSALRKYRNEHNRNGRAASLPNRESEKEDADSNSTPKSVRSRNRRLPSLKLANGRPVGYTPSEEEIRTPRSVTAVKEDPIKISIEGIYTDSLITAAGSDPIFVNDYITGELNYCRGSLDEEVGGCKIQLGSDGVGSAEMFSGRDSLTNSVKHGKDATEKDEYSSYGTPKEDILSGNGETKPSFIRHQLEALFQPTDNKLAMKLFGSKKALMKERIRQKAAGHWIIHPCSNFR